MAHRLTVEKDEVDKNQVVPAKSKIRAKVKNGTWNVIMAITRRAKPHIVVRGRHMSLD